METPKEPWGFCETPEEKCTMNYCDDNGCQNRKRALVSEPKKLETLYRKVVVSDIEMNKWYLRDTEDGYFDMFYCTKLECKTISGIGIINNEIDNDLEFEKHYFMSDFFELKEIPDPIAQLQADKAELLEALVKLLYGDFFNNVEEQDFIESLIKKHRK